MTSPNPFLFVVGCPRSGTTLLERILNAHPKLAIIHETHWITSFYKKKTGISKKGRITPEFIDLLADHHRFHLLDMTRADLQSILDEKPKISYEKFITRIFDHFGAKRNKTLVGDKTTGASLRNLPLLHQLWPAAKLIHLIRDGRDVMLSMLSWPKAARAAGRFDLWKENPVATTALWWNWQVGLALNEGRTIGPQNCHELRFENLVGNPAPTLQTLCSYLNLPYTEDLLQFNKEKKSTDASLSANQAWLAPTPGLRNWRTQLPPEHIELFEALAGDLLTTLNYERNYPTISPKIKDQAQQYQSWWQTHGPQTLVT